MTTAASTPVSLDTLVAILAIAVSLVTLLAAAIKIGALVKTVERLEKDVELVRQRQHDSVKVFTQLQVDIAEMSANLKYVMEDQKSIMAKLDRHTEAHT